MSIPSLRIARRSLLGAGLALPLLRGHARAARTPGTLTFGLSTYPPSIAPWANTGTASLALSFVSASQHAQKPTVSCTLR